MIGMGRCGCELMIFSMLDSSLEAWDILRVSLE